MGEIEETKQRQGKKKRRGEQRNLSKGARGDAVYVVAVEAALLDKIGTEVEFSRGTVRAGI